MKGKGWLAWGVLAVALAAPLLLFRQWKVSLKGRPLAIGGKGLFGGRGGAEAAPRLFNPILARPAPAALPAAPADRALPGGGARPARSTAALPGPWVGAPQSAPMPPTLPSAPAAPGPEPRAPPSPMAAADSGAGPGSSIEINRDPTLSPNDIKLQARRLLERELAQRQTREEAARRKNRSHGGPLLESRLFLMGIIQSKNGTTAIVNDSIVKVGDRVLGAKVRRITGNTVVFEHKSRTFSKTIRR